MERSSSFASEFCEDILFKRQYEEFKPIPESNLSTSRVGQNTVILRTVNECLSKLKISMIMPRIFENPLTVSERLKGTEYQECATMLQKYLKERAKNVGDKCKEWSCFDEKLVLLIEMFLKNYNLIEHLPSWLNDITVSDQLAIEGFQLLNIIASSRLSRTAATEIAKERELHKFMRENQALRKDIEYLKRKLRNQRQMLRWKLAARGGDNQIYQDELTIRKWANVNEIRQEQTKAAQRIRKLLFGHNNKVKELEDEAKQLQEKFVKTKLANVKQLKIVREEKNKLLIQLLSAIEKHDKVLFEKFTENVYLQDEYDKQREDADIVTAEFMAAEKEYQSVIIAEKMEKERLWQQKVDMFTRVRAVRVLQRYLRQYLKGLPKFKKQAKKGEKKIANKKGKK